MRYLKYHIVIITTLCAVCILISYIILQVQLTGSKHVLNSFENISTSTEFAIILGASVKQDGSPSDVLRDRVETGIELFQNGSVRKLLFTGDDGKKKENEIEAMLSVAREKGIPSNVIMIDYNGYRTYESCKNAATVFNINKAVIVTQRFHLPRAIFLCEHFGIKMQGVAADKHRYKKIIFFALRDLLSGALAWWEIYIHAPNNAI